MKTWVPAYYTKFQCIADRCRHNCCIGWEIDIDEESYARYREVSGPFGKRLREGIDDSAEPPCFRLGAGERCAFLNDQGLCDIITALGEDALCEICALHPRYRNFFGDRVEMGLGLCCEEACRLILNENDPVSLTVLEDDGEEDLPLEEESDFYAVRDRILSILQNRALTYDERAAGLVAFCGLHSDTRTPSQWAEIYRSLERLDHAWDACLDRLDACRTWAGGDERDTVWEQLAVYFILRYAGASLDDGLLAPRVAYALHAVSVIRTLGQGMDVEALCELCRMYSCEIEYSEENIETLMERMTV
jgi:lysine-N-methylase